MQALKEKDWAACAVHTHTGYPADRLLGHRTMSHSRHTGKIRKRLEDIKNQSLKLAKADFSHNESIRLATDAFLDGGTDSYLETLGKEGEVDFLSSVEAQYIRDHAKESYYACEPAADGAAGAKQQSEAASLPSGTYFPTASESSEPPLLHTWSAAEKPYLKEKSTATVYFQTEKNSNIRDIIRRYISKTTQVLAIVMDVFTDTEILCDLLEAANKRMVFVYLLLDHGNIELFSEMCDKLQVAEDLFKNISVRSVTGEVYCAKSGRKFAGQIQEKFLISDWRYVLSGSYRLETVSLDQINKVPKSHDYQDDLHKCLSSVVQKPKFRSQMNHQTKMSEHTGFTWLCGQVHRNLLSKFTGQVVELFDEEFRHLYALSKPVMGAKSPPRTGPVLLSAVWTTRRSPSDSSPGSANTLSDAFSSLSAGSAGGPKRAPPAPLRSSGFMAPSPLRRVNSFHSYVPFTPPPQALPAPYYQPHYDSTALLYSNMNIYRPIRLRQEEPNRTGLNSPWRCLHKANLFV